MADLSGVLAELGCLFFIHKLFEFFHFLKVFYISSYKSEFSFIENNKYSSLVRENESNFKRWQNVDQLNPYYHTYLHLIYSIFLVYQ